MAVHYEVDGVVVVITLDRYASGAWRGQAAR
jgi:hypothetical protein